MSKIIGYVRVSTFEQNTDRQLEGIKTDKTFLEKVSGKSTDRPQLIELLNYIRDGDQGFCMKFSIFRSIAGYLSNFQFVCFFRVIFTVIFRVRGNK